MGHPFLFFVDEQNYSWPDLAMFDWERIAYIKCFENDFISDDDFIRWKNSPTHNVSGFSFESGGKSSLKLPVAKTPVIIAIYTGKDKDFRTMPGGLNRISVAGYSAILPFHPDSRTLYWQPFVRGNSFRVRFWNREQCKRFRLIVEGVDARGHPVHFEKILK
jgi:hypothetical protein